jgi:tRNA modification GTPase
MDVHDRATLESLAGRPHRIVLNKCDLLAARPICNQFSSPPILVSAKTGEGLEELKQSILRTLTESVPESDTALVTNLRQHEAIADAVANLERAHLAATGSLPHEMLLLDLHAGLEALDRLTGATTTDDILSLIFSTFCIGK